MAAAAASAGGWAEAKARGNRAYANGENAAAAAAYSEALRDESVPAAERATLLSNRAQVHLKAGAAALAVEDCTASLTHAPDNVKALYRRACAYEALGDLKDALRDYERAVALTPAGLPDAAAGAARVASALGLARARAGGGAPGAVSSAPGGGGGGGGAPGRRAAGVSPEEAKLFDELQSRVREVAVQTLRAREQARVAAADKKRADLTLAQVTPLPEDRPVYTAVGRMFMRQPKADVLAAVTAGAARAETKAAVCARTLAHLESQEREADEAVKEFLQATAKARGGEPGARMTVRAA